MLQLLLFVNSLVRPWMNIEQVWLQAASGAFRLLNIIRYRILVSVPPMQCFNHLHQLCLCLLIQFCFNKENLLHKFALYCFQGSVVQPVAIWKILFELHSPSIIMRLLVHDFNIRHCLFSIICSLSFYVFGSFLEVCLQLFVKWSRIVINLRCLVLRKLFLKEAV